jgi:hypothetical protein
MKRFHISAGLGYVTESLQLAVPSKTFLQITHANQVKMKLGSTEFHLRENQLEALCEIVNVMTA